MLIIFKFICYFYFLLGLQNPQNITSYVNINLCKKNWCEPIKWSWKSKKHEVLHVLNTTDQIKTVTKEKSLITYLKETQAKVAKSTFIVYVTGKTYIQDKIVEPRLILNFLCLLALIQD